MALAEIIGAGSLILNTQALAESPPAEIFEAHHAVVTVNELAVLPEELVINGLAGKNGIKITDRSNKPLKPKSLLI